MVHSAFYAEEIGHFACYTEEIVLYATSTKEIVFVASSAEEILPVSPDPKWYQRDHVPYQWCCGRENVTKRAHWWTKK